MTKAAKVNLSTAIITHLAKLASLPITTAETADLESSLNSILSFVSEVQTLKLDGLEPIAQVTHKTNEFRADVVAPSFTQDQALLNASHTHGGYFLVPRILQDES